MNPLCKLFPHNQFSLNIYKTFHAEQSEFSIPNCCNYKEKVIFELSCVVLHADKVSIIRIYTEKNIAFQPTSKITTFLFCLGFSDQSSVVLRPKRLHLSCSSYPSSVKAANVAPRDAVHGYYQCVIFFPNTIAV